MGEVPSWYRLLQAAKYLQVPPWDLAQRASWWTEVALTAMTAEHAASSAKSKRKSSSKPREG